MKTQNQRIGFKIKEYRSRKKLLQSELGNKIGVQANTISAYERGLIEIPRSRLEDLAEVLDVSLKDILGMDGDNQPVEAKKEDATEEKHGLSASELEFITSIIEKAMILDDADRGKLFGHLELTVMFFENGSL